MREIYPIMCEAEKAWREDVKRDYPIFANTKVIMKNKSLIPDNRDWSFSTDMRTVYANIYGDDNLQHKFENVVTEYWDGEPEELALETLHYLFHHELYHRIEAPRSIKGDNNDSKLIHQAIRRGVLKAEPKLTPQEQVSKVYGSQNAIKDLILDNRFFLENEDKHYVRGDIIPVWDLIGLADSTPHKDLYTITRHIYGTLYGPESTYEFFAEKAGPSGAMTAEKALSALLRKDVSLPSKMTDETKYREMDQYAQDIRDVFSGEDRYNGIERLMSVLGPYADNIPYCRSDIGANVDGEGCGCSIYDILNDLLDDMNPEEQAQFGSDLFHSDSTDHGDIDIRAAHEFYKRNHPKINIIGGNAVGESKVVGKQEYWGLKSTKVITKEELANMNLQTISRLAKKTGLPWLTEIETGLYRLNEYEIKSRDIKDIFYTDGKIDIPDRIEFYIDSSGSMHKVEEKDFRLNDGSRWDMLLKVMYGFTDALQQAGDKLGKETEITIHNFASEQIDSPPSTIEQFMRGEPDILRTIFKPYNGDATYPNIKEIKHPGKVVYLMFTDGEVKNPEREAKKMSSIAKKTNNQVVLFEIEKTYKLGKEVKNDKNIKYYQVHDMDTMLKNGLDVMLSK